MVKVAVIGCGRWGGNYVRLFEELPGARVVLVYDKDEAGVKKLLQRFPGIKAAKSLAEVTASDCEAVIVATPAATHCEVTKKCLEAGKHVLVEKPIATTAGDAEQMISLAESKKRILMVGHTFLFNPGVKALKNYVRDPSFGDIYYLHATRTNMGPIRTDVNAAWDLAPHDVSIFNYLLDKSPQWVSATGAHLFDNGRADLAFMTLGYPGNVIANIHVSWADPYKVREVVAVGSRRRIVFDDLDGLERLKIFDKGVTRDESADSFGEFRLLMRDGDILSPRVENSEPLKEQCLHFLECIEKGAKPVSNGYTGLDVIRAMIAADESMRRCGAPVEIAEPCVQDGKKTRCMER